MSVFSFAPADDTAPQPQGAGQGDDTATTADAPVFRLNATEPAAAEAPATGGFHIGAPRPAADTPASPVIADNTTNDLPAIKLAAAPAMLAKPADDKPALPKPEAKPITTDAKPMPEIKIEPRPIVAEAKPEPKPEAKIEERRTSFVPAAPASPVPSVPASSAAAVSAADVFGAVSGRMLAEREEHRKRMEALDKRSKELALALQEIEDNKRSEKARFAKAVEEYKASVKSLAETIDTLAAE